MGRSAFCKHKGEVVSTAVTKSVSSKVAGSSFDLRGLTEHIPNDLVGDHVGQSVTTEQKRFARQEGRLDAHMGLDWNMEG